MSFMKWMSGGTAGAGANANNNTILGSGSSGSTRSEFPNNDDRYYGLVNVGNICYCSSVLQSLYFCRAFRECVNNYPYPQQHPGNYQTDGGVTARTDMTTQIKSPGTLSLERSVSVLAGMTAGSDPGQSLPPLPVTSINGLGSQAAQLTPQQTATAGLDGGMSSSNAGESVKSVSRGRTLTSIRERAAGFRRKKGRSGTDSEETAARGMDRAVNGSGESKSSVGNDSGNSKSSSGVAGAVASSAQARHTTEGQGYDEQPGIDAAADIADSVASCSIDSSMFSELKDLFWHISTRKQRTGSLLPQAFIGKLKECNELFRSNAHQDAHEFLNYLLNEIVENVEKIDGDKGLEQASAKQQGQQKIQGSTWVHTLFEGLLTNETRCLSCENVTSRDETMLDVSVDIHENTSVTSCLRQFAAGELLCHNNKFYCDNCGGLQEAERRMRLKRLPNILALHLKRFKYHEGLGRHVKLSYRVNFPTELRVPNTTEETEDVLYSLSAVAVHLGGGLFHGHYISIVRSGTSWVLFDDDCVELIDENELSNYFGDLPTFGSGYLLFYERADFDPAQFNLPHPCSSPIVPSVSANKLHVSETMPNLGAASKEHTDKTSPVSPQFPVPTRPPPLVATTRSFRGGADLFAQMSSSSPNSPISPTQGWGQPAPAAVVNTAVDSLPPTTLPPVQSDNLEHTNGTVPIKGRSWFGRRSKK
ncbi:cysteine proteinase [Coemansia reversa NRRL 1564]|uniref:Ubiquitin carboxyl-terminal hydrolase n=1 Tax=Coemansia reversa (strain ATCC 12441 / NRRL 1564) TaxID=763665 RepID=A0A2G5BDE3_COERN|nr:cysteine proteinase [Coemansia reversa NRRL 1564]|eukprot:PIA17031.1 cysteine proteinase [Coemansia reversa NRRL 1564]